MGGSTTGTRLGNMGEANHGCFWRSVGAASVHPPGSDARGKLAVPRDWRRCGDRGNKREQWRDKTQTEKRGEDNGGKQRTARETGL